MSVSAVLFDVDGTLVDSNYLHVDAWQRAFAELREPVDAWRIHRAIGQDSALLLESLVGQRDEEWMSRAKELHSTYYRELVPRLRAFAHAQDLLRALSDRDVRVVLATSAPDDELEMLLRVLDCGDAIHATTSATDADEAKPHPDILKIALDRAGALPSEAVMVGDSIWDIEAAARAEVQSIGVLSGGTGAAELADAGSRGVFDDVAALFEQVEEWI